MIQISLPYHIRQEWRPQQDIGNSLITFREPGVSNSTTSTLRGKYGELDLWTVSSLAKVHLKTQLDHCCRSLQDEHHVPMTTCKIPSLSSISAGKIIEVLANSDNVEADIRTIARSINSVTLRQIIIDPRTPYPVLRAFLAIPSIAKSSTYPVDIDEAILANENHIRSLHWKTSHA